MFTGSGMPMRFADLNGSMINVYQAATQMTDESGQSYPFTIDTLLNRALGPEGYYGVFTANMHTDNASRSAPTHRLSQRRERRPTAAGGRQLCPGPQLSFVDHGCESLGFIQSTVVWPRWF